MSLQDMSRRATAASRLNQIALAFGLCALAVASAANSAEPEPAPVEEPPTPVAEPEVTPSASEEAAPAIDAQSDLELPADLGQTVDLLFADFDVVVSAGRQARPVNMASAPVSVLTAEDIHYSGLTSLPEMFRFVPGMDVLRLDRNRYAIGVRGLHHEFADRTLVLIDGRNAGSAIFGGTDFQRLPFFTEDLARIEFVRGPGGAAWGPNAFNGVINVLHKPVDETLGLLTSATLDEFGDITSQFRWGAREGKFAWRISVGQTESKSSEDAIESDDFDSDDFSRTLSVTGDALYGVGEDTNLTFGFGYRHLERGSFDFLGIYPDEDERIDYGRAHVKLAHDFGGGASGYVQWYGTFEDVNRPSLWRYDSSDNNIEAQLTFEPSTSHTVTFGASGRFVTIDSNPARADDLLGDRSFDEQWAGIFGIDTWQITNRFTLETQLRGDWYSETELDWSGRLSALYAMDADKQHVLRASVAKAFRAPQASLREIDTRRVPLPSPPLPPGLFGATLVGDEDADNEQTYAIEAGYFGRLNDDLTLRGDIYYQWYTDLLGAVVFDDPFMLGRTIAEIANTGDAEAWGAEIELAYTHKQARLSAWYAYNDFDLSEGPDQSVRAFLPARHKVGATARWTLTKDWTLNANYRWTDTTRVDGVGNMELASNHRLDLAAAVAVLDGRGEIEFGMWDVLNHTEEATRTVGSTSGLEFETPGRALFVRLQLRF